MSGSSGMRGRARPARRRWTGGVLAGMAGVLLVVLSAACTPQPRAEGAKRAERQAGVDSIRPLAPPGVPAGSFPPPSRPVADIVTDTWSSEDARDRADEAPRVMELLGIGAGMAVADVGAGSGYYVARLSPRVGPAGRVIAQDIMPEYLERLRGRVRRERLGNVTLALGDPHDPRLPRASADLALLVHMYHEVEQPYALLYNLRPALRPGARVAVVDLDRPTNRHGTPPALLRCEFEVSGYRQVAFHDLGAASGYLAVFAPREGPPPAPGEIRACPAPARR